MRGAALLALLLAVLAACGGSGSHSAATTTSTTSGFGYCVQHVPMANLVEGDDAGNALKVELNHQQWDQCMGHGVANAQQGADFAAGRSPTTTKQQEADANAKAAAEYARNQQMAAYFAAAATAEKAARRQAAIQDAENHCHAFDTPTWKSHAILQFDADGQLVGYTCAT